MKTRNRLSSAFVPPKSLKIAEYVLDLICRPGARILILILLLIVAVVIMRMGFSFGERLGAGVSIVLIFLLGRPSRTSGMAGLISEIFQKRLRGD